MQPTRFTRRNALKLAALASAGSVLPFSASALSVDRARLTHAYLLSLAKPDGGFGWPDQPHGHLTPTYAVIGALKALGEKPPEPDKLAEFVRTHHPHALKKLEQQHRVFEFQQAQSLVWLGADASALRETVNGWKKPWTFLKQYEKHGYPIFQSEMGALVARELLGLPASELGPDFITYMDARRRANGSFNNTPAADGGDGHIMNTWVALQALATLKRSGEKRDETTAWLLNCQAKSGGFRYAPKPEFGALEGVAFTWSAVRSLHVLGAKWQDAKRNDCISYLHSLANDDGGYGERPGWASNPLATYQAVDALAILDARTQIPPRKSANRESLPAGLKVWSIQIEAHGKGSPIEAVDLAAALKIHLWGAKNAEPRWLAKAQSLADAQKVPVKFFNADEEYGTFVRTDGFGTYSHTSDIISPANADIGASLAKAGEVTWEEYRERRLKPLMKGGGRVIWQFGENEELTRAYLDDSLQRGGYAAISTFHFGNPDFTNSEPFLKVYRGQIPFIALQDAHGNEPWWFADMTEGFRTLFLAKEPTWESWLEALKNDWVAAVRHDAVSGGKTWMHTGSDEVAKFVRDHETDWRWWNNPAIQRPLVSIAVLRPEDEFEAGRPERGVAIRVRCQWENTTQGLPKKELVRLKTMAIDGQRVKVELVRVAKGNAVSDVYYRAELPDLAPGDHAVSTEIELVASGTTGATMKKFTL